jgi:hypothetical protein
MGQLTIRSSDELIERIRAAARHDGRSMNEWVVYVLDSATNPDLIGDRAEQIRERRRQAGMVASIPPRVTHRPSDAAIAAARRAVRPGPMLSDYVSEDRGP